MSYDTMKSTITIDDVTYDVEEHGTGMGTRYTLSFDGEDCFEGLEGRVEMEEHQEDYNPRENESNVGTISVSYRGYKLGDEDISEIDFEVTCPACQGSGETHGPEDRVGNKLHVAPPSCPTCLGDGNVTVNPIDYFKKERGARVVLPLIVYEHSGITMQVGHVGQVMGDAQGWDTSFVGFVFDTPEAVKECMGDDVTDEQIEKALRGEVKHYADYLEGNVTYFTVSDDESNYHESCGGFIGCVGECETEMYAALEDALIKRIAEEDERLYWRNREVLTV